jgi:V/A-type H+/Na+-transporting ATPase subunit K
MADPVMASSVFLGQEAGIAMAAGLALAGSALATAWAQASIGSSIMGVVAERPEEAMKLIIYMALPEIIVILGFVVAFLLMGKMGAAEAAH